jgi:hypothetical protein
MSIKEFRLISYGFCFNLNRIICNRPLPRWGSVVVAATARRLAAWSSLLLKVDLRDFGQIGRAEIPLRALTGLTLHHKHKLENFDLNLIYWISLLDHFTLISPCYIIYNQPPLFKNTVTYDHSKIIASYDLRTSTTVT